MRLFIRSAIALQLLLWIVLLGLGFALAVSPSQERALASLAFFGTLAMIICFVPALRMSHDYDRLATATLLVMTPPVLAAFIFLLVALEGRWL